MSATQDAAGAAAMADWCKRGNPQALLASVTEGVQRFARQLHPHRLGLPAPHALRAAPAQPQGQHRPGKGDCSSHQVVVEDEGVLTPVQVGGSTSVQSCMTSTVTGVHDATVLLGR